MEHYFVLNLFLVVIMLSISCPTEVQGYKGLDYPTRGFYNYPWRRFNYLKRDELDESGTVIVGDKNITKTMNYPVTYKNALPPKDDDEHKSKKASTNTKRLNNVQTGYGMKVLYGRVPGTVMFWPSAL